MGFLILAFLFALPALKAVAAGGLPACPQNLICSHEAALPAAQLSIYQGSFMSLWPNISGKELTPGDLSNDFFLSFFLLRTTSVSLLDSRIETPTLLRFSVYQDVAIYNSLTAFMPRALPFFCVRSRGLLPFATRLTGPANNTKAKNTAALMAVLRITEHIGKQMKMDSKPLIRIIVSLGLDPDYKSLSNMSDPRDIGNAAGSCVNAYADEDEFNSMGLLNSPQSPQPPAFDFTGYMPVNSPYLLSDITRWQPLLETSGNGYFNVQEHIFAYARNCSILPTSTSDVDGFYSNFSAISNPYPLQEMMNETDLDNLMAAADEVILASAQLTDRQKMIAELFDAKARSDEPLNFGASMNRSVFELIYFHSAPLWDATLASWAAKMRVDAIRPISLIRYLYANKTIMAWGGPGKGTREMKGASFQSYLRTMPHSDYPSGTACICVAYVEWAELFTNSPGKLQYTFYFPAGSSAVEPGITPATDLTVSWNTTESFIDECTLSRLHAGVHFVLSVHASKRMCKGIGKMAFQKQQALINGRE